MLKGLIAGLIIFGQGLLDKVQELPSPLMEKMEAYIRYADAARGKGGIVNTNTIPYDGWLNTENKEMKALTSVRASITNLEGMEKEIDAIFDNLPEAKRTSGPLLALHNNMVTKKQEFDKASANARKKIAALDKINQLSNLSLKELNQEKIKIQSLVGKGGWENPELRKGMVLLRYAAQQKADKNPKDTALLKSLKTFINGIEALPGLDIIKNAEKVFEL